MLLLLPMSPQGYGTIALLFFLFSLFMHGVLLYICPPPFGSNLHFKRTYLSIIMQILPCQTFLASSSSLIRSANFAKYFTKYNRIPFFLGGQTDKRLVLLVLGLVARPFLSKLPQ